MSSCISGDGSYLSTLRPSIDAIRLSISSDWGKPSFRGCFWCRRGRACENPLVHERAQYPTLRFRGERHSICNVCAACLRRKHPLHVLGGPKEKKLQCIQNSPSEFDLWLTDIVVMEDEQNGAPRPKDAARSWQGGGQRRA